MDKKLYYRGKAGTVWYNFTECFAYVILHRKTPDNCFYEKVRYGSEKRQYINICSRKDLADVKKPVFIYIHGGGFVSGITEMRDTYVAEWAKKGFFTASISYTYAPDKVFPGQLHEIYAALDKIYELKDKYNIDLDNIVLAGESAGGYYILKLAEHACDKSLYDKLSIDFKNKDSFSVKALVSHCGCFDLKNLLDKSKNQSKFPDIKMMVTSFLGKPYDEAKKYLESEEGALSYPHITADFPPAFIIYAHNDYLRFEAFDFIEEYKKYGIDFAQFEGTGIISLHAWTLALVVEKGRDCFNKAFEYINNIIDNKL